MLPWWRSDDGIEVMYDKFAKSLPPEFTTGIKITPHRKYSIFGLPPSKSSLTRIQNRYDTIYKFDPDQPRPVKAVIMDGQPKVVVIEKPYVTLTTNDQETIRLVHDVCEIYKVPSYCGLQMTANYIEMQFTESGKQIMYTNGPFGDPRVSIDLFSDLYEVPAKYLTDDMIWIKYVIEESPYPILRSVGTMKL